MNGLEFVASLVGSLAWPGAVFAVALVFRRQIIDLLSTGLRRLKAGPFEAEWNLAEQRVPASVRLSAKEHSPDSVESASASISPRSAILARHNELVARLAGAVDRKLGKQPEEQSLGELIDLAEQEGLIDAMTKDALVGVTIMRNLAAHDVGVDADKASEFIALADAIEYAMSHRLRGS